MAGEPEGQIFTLEPAGEPPLRALATSQEPRFEWWKDELRPLTPERVREIIQQLQDWLATHEGMG